jgi:hypothetical protein
LETLEESLPCGFHVDVDQVDVDDRGEESCGLVRLHPHGDELPVFSPGVLNEGSSAESVGGIAAIEV